MPEHGPYYQSAKILADAGWTVIPVRANSKRVAINGYTGADGKYPSYEKMMGWRDTYGSCNIAIRMPEDVIGIDVDQYGDKAGYDTLRKLEDDLGELPRAPVITSRKDGKSGIRLYRVPGLKHWKGIAGPGIEVLTWYHRYAVCAPSVHPDTSAEYRWWSEDADYNLRPMNAVPGPSDVPDLPRAWRDFLYTAGPGVKRGKMDAASIREWISENGSGKPCRTMTEVTGLWIDRLTGAEDAGGAHDAMLGGIKAVVGDAMAGHSGMEAELIRLRRVFATAVGERRSAGDADSEWRRAVFGAVRLHMGTERPREDPCDDPNLAGGRHLGPLRRNGQRVTPESMREQMADPAGKAFAKRVEEEVTRILVSQAARLKVKSSTEMPLPTPVNGAEFVEMDIPPVRIVVESLLPYDGNTLLVAQRKAGKTTLVHNLVRAVVDEDDFLGSFEVTWPDDGGKIAMLDFEMLPGMLKDDLIKQGISKRGLAQLEIMSFRGKTSGFGISEPSKRAELSKMLKDLGCGYMILDCIAPAMGGIGLDESLTADMVLFLNWLDEIAAEGGVSGIFAVHHMGHAGERGRGSSRLRDWPETEIHLVVEGQGESDNGHLRPRATRYLAGEGRLGAFDEIQMSFQEKGKRLWVSGGSRRVANIEAAIPDVQAYIHGHGGASKTAVRSAVDRDNNIVDAAIQSLVESTDICVHKTGRNVHTLWPMDQCPDKASCPSSHRIKIG